LSTFVLASVLCGALIHASWNALIKGQPDKFLAAILVAIGTGLVGVPLMAAYPLPPAAAWPYIIASSLIHVVYFGLVGLAYRTADLGVAYPLTRGSAPLFTAMFAYLLIGEELGLKGWIAALAIALGILALSADAFLRGGLNRATALVAFLNAGIIVLYTLIDGLGARVTGNAPLYVAWMCFGAGLGVFLIALTARANFLTELKSGWWIALLGGVLTFASYSIATWAME
jgi:drug/metabolite transporter (DMT)-like permease